MAYQPTVKLSGETDGGQTVTVPVTGEGHLEVAIHDPTMPFGSVHTESLTPLFQTDAVYGANPEQVVTSTALCGSAGASDSSFVISTGVTLNAQASIQSRKRLRYRAGQGVVARFTGVFTAGVADSYQVAGVGHAEDGFYFGYVGADFGILYSRRGAREVRTLTVTVASSTAENITVTLNGVANTVAVTNSANIQRTVWEIATATYSGWKAYASNPTTVTFVRDSAGAAAGAYSITASTAAGTFAQNRAGAAASETFVAQADWNGDKLNGTGTSGITADWTKGNVFQIGIQYLGFGTITFKVETVAGSNNAVWTTVHVLQLPNTLTATSVRNPSFPFTAAVYSAGSTTDLTLKVGSFAGFIEGGKYLRGPRMSYYAQSNAVTDAAYRPLLTVLNSRFYGGIASQVVVNILSVSGALKHTNPCILYLVKNGTLTGNPSFATFATASSTLWDTAATGITWASNDQVIWTGHLGDTGELDHHFNGDGFEETTLQPGEYLTLAARSIQNNPAWVTGSINTREDQ